MHYLTVTHKILAKFAIFNYKNGTKTVLLDLILPKYLVLDVIPQKVNLDVIPEKKVILDVFLPKYGDSRSYSNKYINLGQFHLNFNNLPNLDHLHL